MSSAYCWKLLGYYYPPPQSGRGIQEQGLMSVLPSVRPSVRHVSFPEQNTKTVRDILTKFGTKIGLVVNWCLLIVWDFFWGFFWDLGFFFVIFFFFWIFYSLGFFGDLGFFWGIFFSGDFLQFGIFWGFLGDLGYFGIFFF